METLEQQVSDDLRPQVHRLRVANRWLIVAGGILAAALVGLGAWLLLQDSSDPLTMAEVDEVYAEYGASLIAGDADRWIEHWSEDAGRLAPDGPTVEGKPAILASIEGRLEIGSVTDLEVSPQEVESFDDLAYVRGTFTRTIELKDGGDPIPYDGKFITVFQRQSDGSWLIYRDIFNSSTP